MWLPHRSFPVYLLLSRGSNHLAAGSIVGLHDRLREQSLPFACPMHATFMFVPSNLQLRSGHQRAFCPFGSVVAHWQLAIRCLKAAQRNGISPETSQVPWESEATLPHSAADLCPMMRACMSSERKDWSEICYLCQLCAAACCG